MEQQQAIDMIRHASLNSTQPRTWADLGSGSGVFTQALAAILPAGSKIIAIDDNAAALRQIRSGDAVNISTLAADFTKPLSLPPLHGVLMANSLHFVQDKRSFLELLKTYLHPAGQILLVEYDLKKGNHWVPYPLPFEEAKKLFTHAGFSHIEKINERPSVYNDSMMYSCICSA